MFMVWLTLLETVYDSTLYNSGSLAVNRSTKAERNEVKTHESSFGTCKPTGGRLNFKLLFSCRCRYGDAPKPPTSKTFCKVISLP